MAAEDYARVKALFNAVCDMPASQREQHLAQHDAALAAQVRALFEREQATTRHFNRPVVELLANLQGDGCEPGDVLGAWTVLERIGHGGMGSVYRARRSDGHFEQIAAIKVLRGMPSAEALEFLARERQILATLSHPNIARLLDGGATASGQPYLVMEFVDGVALDVYCEKLPLPARLRLLLAVCAAVSFAHQRLIVHCDIKPGNVLVDASGRPLLLDFGIARLISTEATADTGIDTRAFTPGYASPEQRDGGAISTATDIYSLGRMLIDLAAPADAQLPADAELGAIAARATAADPAQRYASVEAFAEDLNNYLQRRPVQALADSRVYRTRKFVQRNWPWLTTAALFVLTVAAFTSRVVADRDRAEAAEQKALLERDRALQAQATSRQISDFLASVFDGANPDAGGGEIPTSRLVEQALQRIDGELAGQPATQAELYTTLAGVQIVLGNAAPARDSYDKGIAIQRRLDQPLVLADMLMRRADAVKRTFDKRDAEANAREALALVQKHAPDDLALQARALELLGKVLGEQAKNDEGEPLLLQALQLRERLDGNSQATVDVLGSLGMFYQGKGDYEQSIRHFQRALDIQKRKGQEGQSEYLNDLESMGSSYGLARRFDEAEAHLRHAMEGFRVIEGEDSAAMAWRLSQLGRVVDNSGRALQAIPLYRKALAIGARKMGADSISYSILLVNLALAQRRSGDFAASEKSYVQALPALRRDWPADATLLARVHNDYGWILLRNGKLEDARAVLLTALESRRKAGALSPPALQSEINLADYDLLSGQAAAAWTRLQEVTPHIGTLEPLDRAAYQRVLGLAKTGRGDVDGAMAAFRQAEQITLAELSERDPRSWIAQLDRAALLRGQASAESRRQGAALAGVILGHIDKALAEGSPLRTQLQQLARQP